MISGDTQKLEHLLRRMAFGVRPADYPKWAAMGPDKALHALIDYDSTPDNISPLATDESGNFVPIQDTDSLRRYWLLRLLESSRPFEEVMTLFWHGHFATSDYKVQNPNYMWRQNTLLRTHAMGNFRDMLRGIAIDPAMLVWLDGRSNDQRHPNENWSRELLELFALGVDGGYTEKDVREGARAFTGWTYNDDTAKVHFEMQHYDMAEREYLGKKGNWTLDQAIDIVAAHPSTGRFISKKLFTFFVHDNPPEDEIQRLAKIYYTSKYNIRELVRAVLTSPHFYSDEAAYGIVKSPAQYTVMMGKTLDLPFRWLYDIKDQMDRMGQSLLDPPNVKGWKGGDSWVNTNTLTARMNYATEVVNQIRYRGLMQSRITHALKVRGVDAEVAFAAPETAVRAVWEWILPGAPLPEATHGALVAFMNDKAPKAPKKDYYWRKSASLVELIFTCPEYHTA